MKALFQTMTSWSARPGGTAGGRVVVSSLDRGGDAGASSALSLKFVSDGEERYEIGGSVHVVRPGQFMILDQDVETRCLVPRQARGLCVYLPRAAAQGSDDAPGAEPFLSGPTVLPTRLSPFAVRLEQAAALHAGPAEGDGPDALVELARCGLNALLDEVQPRIANVAAAKASTRMELYRRLEWARAWLHDHPGQPVGLADLARLTGMSRFHLARHFREVFGQPPGAYHSELRLDAAARWLASDAGTVAEAAVRFGYGDASTFTRAFRRRFASTPGRWRPAAR